MCLYVRYSVGEQDGGMMDEKPAILAKTLSLTINKDLYHSIYAILSISVTMPSSSSATAERSFSAMKGIKNYFRSIMGNDFLSSLALHHRTVHKSKE